MIVLVIGLLLFLGVHVFAANRSRADGNVQDKLGKAAYMGAFSLVSAVGLGLVVWGYGLSRTDELNLVLWQSPEWTRHLIMALMPIAMILLIATYAPYGYIKKFVKHPMVTAIKLWAVLHLIYNGDLASILLFGGFLGFAVVSRIKAKRRGAAAAYPKPSVVGDITSIVLGAGVYLALVFGLHQIVFGAPVLVGI